MRLKAIISSKFGISIAFICAILLKTEAFRLQGVAVKGRLMCAGKALRNTHVKVFNANSPKNEGKLLDEGYTDAIGEFLLNGTTRQLTKIHPRLVIYHDCNDGKVPCQKRLPIDIPKEYIHSGKAERPFVVGDIILDDKPSDGRSCDH